MVKYFEQKVIWSKAINVHRVREQATEKISAGFESFHFSGSLFFREGKNKPPFRSYSGLRGPEMASDLSRATEGPRQLHLPYLSHFPAPLDNGYQEKEILTD